MPTTVFVRFGPEEKTYHFDRKNLVNLGFSLADPRLFLPQHSSEKLSLSF